MESVLGPHVRAWHAPAGFLVSSSYTIMAGPWNGPVIDQLPANSPQLAPFGPATVTSSTGARQPNPLATRIRFYYPTRGEGQVKAPDVHTINVKVGKMFVLGPRASLELSANVFNLLNAGNYTEYAAHRAEPDLQPGQLSDVYESADAAGPAARGDREVLTFRLELEATSAKLLVASALLRPTFSQQAAELI